jgi:transcriptional regulator with XRE-family HTH domain
LDIIDKLLDVRVKKGLSQLKLAYLMNSTQAQIHKIECRKIQPRLSLIARYAEALGYKLEINLVENEK